jgi:hypothetical protein
MIKVGASQIAPLSYLHVEDNDVGWNTIVTVFISHCNGTAPHVIARHKRKVHAGLMVTHLYR